MLEALIAIGATLGLCAASAVVPIINGELVMIGAVTAAPHLIVPLVIAASIGQMIGKCAMYLASAGAAQLTKNEKVQSVLERYREKFEHHPKKAAVVVFVAASVGLPPFYVITLIAGAFRFGFWRFALIGFLGRAVRFGVVAAIPAGAHWLDIF